MSTTRSKNLSTIYAAFMNNDLKNIKVQTDDLPLESKNSIASVLDVLNKRKHQGITPFISAILHGNFPLCEKMIEEGFDMGKDVPVDQCKIRGEKTSIENVIMSAQDQCIQGPYHDTFQRFAETTSMFWAALDRQLPLVEKLLNNGFNLNNVIEELSGMTLLIFSAYANNEQLVRKCIDQHCDVHSKDYSNNTALDLAIRRGNADIIKLLLKSCDGPNCTKHKQSPLFTALLAGNLEIFDLLLQLGADINNCVNEDKLKAPPLIMCFVYSSFCGLSSLDFVKYLLSKGANIKVKGHIDNTVLHIMCRKLANGGESDLLKTASFLVQNGADVCAENTDRETPFHLVFRCRSVELVDVFLSVVKDVNNCDPFKNEALLHVSLITFKIPMYDIPLYLTLASDVKKKEVQILNLILEKGADVNIKTRTGLTPLMIAAASSNPVLVQMLINKKANINDHCIKGFSAIFYCIEPYLLHFYYFTENTGWNLQLSKVRRVEDEHLVKVVKILLTKGSKVNCAVNGQTPIHFAVSHACPKVCRLLFQHGSCYTSVLSQEQMNPDISILLQKVDRAFKLVKRRKQVHLSAMLSEYVKKEDWGMYFATVNSVNEEGLTLMALAVERGQSGIAETLMNFRLSAPNLESWIFSWD